MRVFYKSDMNLNKILKFGLRGLNLTEVAFHYFSIFSFANNEKKLYQRF